MSKITISFECDRSFGDWVCKIGDQEFTAKTKAELQEKVRDGLVAHAKTPQLGFARVGKECLISLSHAGNTDTYRPMSDDASGVIPLRLTGSSARGIHADTNANARHLYECAWDASNPCTEILTNISETERDNFMTWVKYQREALEQAKQRQPSPPALNRYLGHR